MQMSSQRIFCTAVLSSIPSQMVFAMVWNVLLHRCTLVEYHFKKSQFVSFYKPSQRSELHFWWLYSITMWSVEKLKATVAIIMFVLQQNCCSCWICDYNSRYIITDHETIYCRFPALALLPLVAAVPMPSAQSWTSRCEIQIDLE